MARKAPNARGVTPDWFLQEWMKALNVKQAELARQCDWTRGTMNGIYHGRTAYYRELVNLVSSKLNIRPYELLMHPDDAMALRRLRQEALVIAETTKTLDEDARNAPAETAPRRRAGTNDR